MRQLTFLFFLMTFSITSLFSAFMENIPMTIKQPDGTVINCFASGDEYFNYLHDKDHYTIIQNNNDGFYYYAVKENNLLIPSNYKVNQVNPRLTNLRPKALINQETYQQNRTEFSIRNERSAPSIGTVQNITILIRFSDQEEYDLPRSAYLNRFNSLHPDSVSMRSYYSEVSQQQLNIMTTIYPVCDYNVNLSYTDSHPRAYYSPYNAVTNPIGYQNEERAYREHTLLKNAVEALEDQIPEDLNIDADNDGEADNVCFIIRGQNDAWAQLLWAHKWALFSYEVSIHGVSVYTYTFQPESQNSVRTLSHEMFHSLGAPDLYHYEHDFSTPVGVWDIMERGGGHMLNWMKYKYANWLPEPSVINPGSHTVNLNTSNTNPYFRINDNNENEFFVIEYRKNSIGLYESNLPESGLIVYRVNPFYNGNAYEGDEIYVFRHDGTPANDGNIMDACLNMQENNNIIANNANPFLFFSNNNRSNMKIEVTAMDENSLSFTLSQTSNAPNILLTGFADQGVYFNDTYLLKVKKLNSQSISQVSYYLDDILIAQSSADPDFVAQGDFSSLSGWHTLKAVAENSTGLTSIDKVSLNFTAPGTAWFNWMESETPTSLIAPGVVPFNVAVSYQLNNQQLVIKKLKMFVTPDPTGQSSNPGVVHAKILRTNEFGYPDSTDVLLDLGQINVSLTELTEYTVPEPLNNVPLSGSIALMLELPEFHQMMVDTTGISGYTWRVNSQWAWKNLVSYGINGSAIMSAQFRPYLLNNETEELPSPLNIEITNYPNPFNPNTVIQYTVKRKDSVCLDIYNIRGQKVITLVNEIQTPGQYQISWNGKDQQGKALSSGVYFAKITTVSSSAVRKMIMIK